MSNWQNNIISEDDEKVKELLASAHSIAVIGMKSDPDRPSFYVPYYMHEQGYEIIPVNPKEDSIAGLKAYSNLEQVPKQVDIVQVFRRSQDVMPHAEEALKMKPRAFWMQTGIINEDAAKLLAQAGISVIMDRCMYVDHKVLLGAKKR